MEGQCIDCRKETDHLRRGYCLFCYRKNTGLSRPRKKGYPPQILEKRRFIIETKLRKQDRKFIVTWWDGSESIYDTLNDAITSIKREFEVNDGWRM